jgi:hypothetical protein
MAGGGRWRWIRLAALLWAIAVVVVTAFFVTREFGLWPDSRLSPEETARQLRDRLHVQWTFTCTRAENDGSLPAEVDYLCQPSRAEEVGYFVDTDSSSIEIVSQTG